MTTTRPSGAALGVRLVVSALLATIAAIAMLPVAAATGFRARRLYAAATTRLARAILRVWGVQLRIHPPGGFPRSQVVYISNHSSTIDLFALVALGLPNTRFFLSGFLQKFVPLAVLARLMGTFFTVPQSRPDDRRRIFSRASETLRRTGESVYLSPEGERVTTGEIGPFNKGAFHLATSLRAPIVPLHFVIPPEIDPGKGYDIGAGVVDIYIKPAIDTSAWHVGDVVRNKERVRELFVAWHRQARPVRRLGWPDTAGVRPISAEVR
jgi:1-acyl-sn-glycerol-3-phosphate acyltransferase